jgi:hypothetical protein
MLGGRNIFQARRNDFQAGRNKIQARRNKNKIDFLPQFEPFQWVASLFAAFLLSSLLPLGRSAGSVAASDERSMVSVSRKDIDGHRFSEASSQAPPRSFFRGRPGN